MKNMVIYRILNEIVIIFEQINKIIMIRGSKDNIKKITIICEKLIESLKKETGPEELRCGCGQIHRGRDMFKIEHLTNDDLSTCLMKFIFNIASRSYRCKITKEAGNSTDKIISKMASDPPIYDFGYIIMCLFMEKSELEMEFNSQRIVTENKMRYGDKLYELYLVIRQRSNISSMIYGLRFGKKCDERDVIGLNNDLAKKIERIIEKRKEKIRLSLEDKKLLEELETRVENYKKYSEWYRSFHEEKKEHMNTYKEKVEKFFKTYDDRYVHPYEYLDEIDKRRRVIGEELELINKYYDLSFERNKKYLLKELENLERDVVNLQKYFTVDLNTLVSDDVAPKIKSNNLETFEKELNSLKDRLIKLEENNINKSNQIELLSKKIDELTKKNFEKDMLIKDLQSRLNNTISFLDKKEKENKKLRDDNIALTLDNVFIRSKLEQQSQNLHKLDYQPTQIKPFTRHDNWINKPFDFSDL